MMVLGYSYANLDANIDEFYRLNRRYIKKAKSNEIETLDPNSDWRLIRSSTSGVVYKYSFKAGDKIILPIHRLRSYALRKEQG